VDKPATSLLRFFLRLRRAVGEVAPDVVHTWLCSANFWGRWAAVMSGVRHLVASDRSAEQPAGFFIRLYEQVLASRTERLANSRVIARGLEQKYGLPQDRIRVVYNAVHVPVAEREAARAQIRRELGISESHYLVVMVARQTWEKNYPMLIRAAARVRERRQDVTFVGVGRGMMMAELGALAMRLGVGQGVRFVDQRDDVPRWLAAADVFCLTSNTEGFPNAVLEAMMAGLPVVCTSFPSARELIPRDELGILVPRDDDAAMAARVVGLLDDAAWRQRLGTAGQLWVGQRYSWPALVREMESLYTELVSAPGGRGS